MELTALNGARCSKFVYDIGDFSPFDPSHGTMFYLFGIGCYLLGSFTNKSRLHAELYLRG